MQSKRIRRVVFCCVVLGAAALVAGCATKGWVNETVNARIAPLETNLGQVNGQVSKLGTQLTETRAVADAASTKAGVVAVASRVPWRTASSGRWCPRWICSLLAASLNLLRLIITP